jgi:hypothetical protein
MFSDLPIAYFLNVVALTALGEEYEVRGCGLVYLLQDSVQWRAVVDTIMIPFGSIKASLLLAE